MSAFHYNTANLPDDLALLRGRVADLERAEAERRQAEAALRESRARLRTVISHTPIILFAIDREGIITLSEGKALDVLNLKPGEVVGRSVFEIYPDVPQVAESLRRALRGEAFSSQIELAGAAFETRLTPLRDEAGEVSGVIGVATDITDRLRAERDLRASEEKFRLLAENVPGIIYLCRNDARYTMRYLNDEVERVTGYSPREFLEDRISFADLFHPDDAPAVYRGVNEAVSRGEPFHLIYRIRCKDGHLIWVEEFGVGVYRGDELAFLEGYITDITQRVADQKALEESKADLEKRVVERTEHLRVVNDRALRMQEELAHVLRVATVGEMASGLAHELNQPLSAILNYIQGAKRRIDAGAILQAELLGVFDKVAAQAERAANILKTVRQYITKRPACGTCCDLNSVVRDSLELAETDIRENGVRLDLSLEPDLPESHCDHVQVEQVVLNLVRNGIQAMESVPPEERVLRIATRRHGEGAVELVIQDTGPGLTVEQSGRAFEPFHSTKEGGLGMGLSISRSIIEAHEGRIWVAPRAPQSPVPAFGGAEFHLTLPVKGGEQ